MKLCFMLPQATVTNHWSHFCLNKVPAPHSAFMIFYLIHRTGANPVALNKSQLTPFHASIQAGNTPVVRLLLNQRGRSSEGYHPSKVSAAGRTPLQLAIASGIPSTVELLVKDATTHDVQRCWEREEMSDEIRNLLKTKVSQRQAGGLHIHTFCSLA